MTSEADAGIKMPHEDEQEAAPQSPPGGCSEGRHDGVRKLHGDAGMQGERTMGYRDVFPDGPKA